MTAGVIESEIRNNNKCDFDRYYGKESAYHSIADAIQKRMDVPAKATSTNVAQHFDKCAILRQLALQSHPILATHPWLWRAGYNGGCKAPPYVTL